MALKTREWQRLPNEGLSFTELGFGTAPLGNLYRAISDDEAQAILEKAWEGGVRYYDTAPLYGLGLSETRLNRFLRGKPRDDYILSSKVGRVMQVNHFGLRLGQLDAEDAGAHDHAAVFGGDSRRYRLAFCDGWSRRDF
jgi:aryl-alcohol dehydrogenase-like predicted oxidoreductase